ncbi:MAG: pilin [Rhodanobacteraceae bacterium]
MNKIQKGFTLIELMIVVAIIAILAAIAIPAYQDYVIRSQVSEGMSLLDGSKTAVAEFYSNRGHFPKNNESAGLAPKGKISGNYVSEVEVTDGLITATFSNSSPQKANDAINGKKLVLSPATTTGGTQWSCTSTAGTDVDDKYLPSQCSP